MARFALVGLWLCARLAAAAIVSRDYPSDEPLAACPGYKASNVKTSATGLTADLKLAGKACNVYGTDLDNLILEVTYETGKLPCSPPRQHPLTIPRQPPPRQNPRRSQPSLPSPSLRPPPTSSVRRRRRPLRPQVRLQDQPLLLHRLPDLNRRSPLRHLGRKPSLRIPVPPSPDLPPLQPQPLRSGRALGPLPPQHDRLHPHPLATGQLRHPQRREPLRSPSRLFRASDYGHPWSLLSEFEWHGCFY